MDEALFEASRPQFRLTQLLLRVEHLLQGHVTGSRPHTMGLMGWT